ncbi:tetratricopeptide repeat protein [Pseudoduganella sp. LjRoot289]|uniref:KGGVGR-motif variant AAA ATPase n=1 Tax=Pseudoduganella sp. LjRoot289 TaxID=3342314 RepID=UPI003ECD0AE0
MELPHLLPPLATPGEVITFHSHKGGAGRSMAVANAATLLAGRGQATMPVLAIDWDLEAPGLHQFFPAVAEGPGVLEFFTACREQLQRRNRRSSVHNGAAPKSAHGAVRDAGRDPARNPAHAAAHDAAHDAELARQVLAAVGWERYVLRVDQSRPLYLMRAGRLDAGYAERVAAFNWEALFHACPALFRCFSAMLSRHFRHVLVDARSGRTDSSGICTTLLPTRLVLLFEANRQSLEGLQSLVQRATTYRRSHEDEQRPLLIYPLPTRTDMECSAQRALCRRGDPATGLPGYQPTFEQALGEAYGVADLSLESYFDEVQLPQSRSLARGERLAVRGEPVADRFSVTRAYEALLGWLADGHPPWRSQREIPLLAAVDHARRSIDAGGARSMMLARELFRLGLLYVEEGRHAAATLALRESLALHVKMLGEEHVETAAAKAQLARVLLLDGELDQARILLRCVVETRTRLLGAEHPDVLEACTAQASALAQQGYFEAALDRQDAVLQVQLRVLGQEHLETLASQAARAAILYLGGDLELARQAQEQVLAVRARLLGAEHPETVRVGEALLQTMTRMAQLDLEGRQAQNGLEPHPQEGRTGALRLAGQRPPRGHRGQDGSHGGHGVQPGAQSGDTGPLADGLGEGVRVPGIEQAAAPYCDAPYSLQRAELLQHEQLQPEEASETRAELR